MARTRKSKQPVAGWVIPLSAIAVIGGLEAYALSKGINGKVFVAAMCAIAGIAGFKLRELFK